MHFSDIVQIFISLLVIIIAAPFLGSFFAKVYTGKSHLLRKPLGWLETLSSRAIGKAYDSGMSWKTYSIALLCFNLIGIVFTILVQMFQAKLPGNPGALPNVPWHLAINTAVSFVSNTNWQSYAGETTLSWFTQMVVLTVQNFLSAATGMAVAVALARGVAGRSSDSLGNFWQDVVRSIVYILLPFSILFAGVLASEGVIQNFSPSVEVTTLEGGKQTIPQGPVASQIAIKQIGTNGGGYFNANSGHPYENPTPFTNWLELVAILLIAGGFPFLYGEMVNNRKHGAVLFITMFTLLSAGLLLSLWSEYSSNAVLGLNALMEGKETRIGVTNSILWSTFTSAASNGSVNAMMSSLSPLAGGIALFNIMLGEIIFGGVGSGLYGMVLFVILTVFITGLMVGRTPEYLGKKIEAKEVQMTILAVLIPSFAILVGSGISLVLPIALSSMASKGPHGLTEVLYAFTSAAGNNGSAFAGLNANTPYYNVMLSIGMLLGRFGVIFPVLAIAGSLASKKYSPPSFGTFTTENGLFIALLIAVIIVVGGLTFFPALCLGPIMEHFLMQSGKTF